MGKKQTLKWQIWLLGPQKAISSGPILDFIHQCQLAVALIICVCLCVRVKAGPHRSSILIHLTLYWPFSGWGCICYAVLCFVIWDQLYQVPNALCVSSSSFLKFRSYSITMVLIVSHCSLRYQVLCFLLALFGFYQLVNEPDRFRNIVLIILHILKQCHVVPVRVQQWHPLHTCERGLVWTIVVCTSWIQLLQLFWQICSSV